MSVADEVRKSYTPPKKPAAKPENLYRKVAEGQMTLVIESLKYLGKKGITKELYIGFLGLKKIRAVTTSIAVSIDSAYRPVMSLSYEGDPCGIGVGTKADLYKVQAELERLCANEGIGMKYQKAEGYFDSRFVFWIEVP